MRLTSTIVNIVESIVKSSIFDHLIPNNLISSSQFGFLPGHSSTMQLLHVMDIITSSLDHELPVDVIYLNLQKALDSVPRLESIMSQNLLIMLLAFPQFSACYAHFYAFYRYALC